MPSLGAEAMNGLRRVLAGDKTLENTGGAVAVVAGVQRGFLEANSSAAARFPFGR